LLFRGPPPALADPAGQVAGLTLRLPAALWATATANRHRTLTIGPSGATTLTIDLTPATAHSVQMPTGAVHLTSYAARTPQLGH
jgi:hypothetical protein